MWTSNASAIASLLNPTVAMEDVKTTLFIEADFVHDLRTFSVPFTAGSTSSVWNIVEQESSCMKIFFDTLPRVFKMKNNVSLCFFKMLLVQVLNDDNIEGKLKLGTRLTCGSIGENETGDAVWNTAWQPSTRESKDPSSNRLASNKWSLSLAPSSESKCCVFFGSPDH